MTSVQMTVGSLRAALANFPEDLPVLVASDEEGNSFEHLYDVEVSKYYEIDREIQTIHPDDVDEYDQDDLSDAVVLWP
jgi:hypothetical protein